MDPVQLLAPSRAGKRERNHYAKCSFCSHGAEYIKTSTGFSKGGATFDDVALLRAHCAPEVKVKAAGGISTIEDAERFIALGAERLGTSRIVRLAKEAEKAEESE